MVTIALPHTYIDKHTSTNAPSRIIVVSPRCSKQVQLVGAQTIRLRPRRTFLRTVFHKIGASTSGASGVSTPGACGAPTPGPSGASTSGASGASTPGQAQGHCIVSVLHTRRGTANTGQKINHANPLEFKLDRDLEMVGVGPQ